MSGETLLNQNDSSVSHVFIRKYDIQNKTNLQHLLLIWGQWNLTSNQQDGEETMNELDIFGGELFL